MLASCCWGMKALLDGMDELARQEKVEVLARDMPYVCDLR